MQLTTLLLEIKLDGFVSQISNFIMQYVKKTKTYYDLGQEKKIGPLDKNTGYRVNHFADYEEPIIFTLYLALQRTNKVSKIGFAVDANSGDFKDDPNILLSIALDPEKEPQIQDRQKRKAFLKKEKGKYMKYIGFKKEITTGRYLDPFNGFQPKEIPIELRYDETTGVALTGQISDADIFISLK